VADLGDEAGVVLGGECGDHGAGTVQRPLAVHQPGARRAQVGLAERGPLDVDGHAVGYLRRQGADSGRRLALPGDGHLPGGVVDGDPGKAWNERELGRSPGRMIHGGLDRCVEFRGDLLGIVRQERADGGRVCRRRHGERGGQSHRSDEHRALDRAVSPHTAVSPW
jgi:hypothetical protein